jgi:gliding motility-associated-like protein
LVLTPERDTLCNETFTNIIVTSPTVPTNAVKYKFTVETSDPGVYVDPVPAYDIDFGTVIIDSISNTTVTKQRVLFIITPYLWDNNNLEKDCYGIIDTAIIWINPTPIIDIALPDPGDTLYCNESPVEFSVTTLNYDIIGDIVYDIDAVYTDITGVTEGGPFINDQTGFTDTLVNSHLTDIRMVTYTFKPRFINVSSDVSECDIGIDTTIRVYIGATLDDTLTSETKGLYVGGNDLRCFGMDSSFVNLDVWGGFGDKLGLGPYNFNWDPAASIDPASQNQDYLFAGTYPVQITDPIGCTKLDTIVLTQPDLFYTLVDSVVENPCRGGSQAAIFISPYGGIAGYKYFWQAPLEQDFYTRNINNLIEGDYNLTVWDTNNCTYVWDTILLDPNPNSTFIENSRFGSEYQITCYGDSTGWIEVRNALGNGPDSLFTYRWTMPSGDTLLERNLYNLPNGDYFLTVIDTIGCIDTVTVNLAEPPPITIDSVGFMTFAGGFNISCFGTNNGAIDIFDNDVDRIGRSHRYTWTGPPGSITDATSMNQDSLFAGTYYLHIRDSTTNWVCTLDTSFTLIQPGEILLDTAILSDYNGYEIACNGGLSGGIQVSATGGLPMNLQPYNYEWYYLEGQGIVGGNNDTISGLAAGNYRLTVEDSLLCAVDFDFTLDEPETLVATWVPLVRNGSDGVNISCFNGTDGLIENLIVTGGVDHLAYQYYWTRNADGSWNSADSLPSGLPADYYTLLVTDANGCQVSFSDSLIQPDTLVIGNIWAVRPSCAGADNGSVGVENVSGGSGPYDYLWDTPAMDTTAQADNLPPGTYTVIVTDLNYCTATRDTTIGEPEVLEVTIDSISTLSYNGQMISCYGESDAILGAIMDGGTRPYDFRWEFYQNGWVQISVDSILDNRPSGLHRVTMEDVNGCVDTVEIFITQPERLSSQTFVTEAACYNTLTGGIDLHMAGGTPGYIYSWSNNEITSEIQNLLSGNYNVTVVDANNCDYDTTIYVPQPDTLVANLDYTLPSCPDAYDGTAWILPAGGTAPYSIDWSNGGSGDSQTNLGPGLIVVRIQDDNFCEVSDTVLLTSDAESCLIIPTAFTPNADGYNDVWEIEGLEYYPGAIMEIYNRWGVQIFYSENYMDEPFDGTHRGRDLPVDSYHYILRLPDGIQPLTGNVTILK